MNNLSGMTKKKKCVNWGDLVSEMEVTLDKSDTKDNMKLGEDLKLYCELTMQNLEEYFQGTHYFEMIKQYMPITRAEFQSQLNATRFHEDISDPLILQKKRILDGLIKNYKTIKREYMTRDSGVNLLDYFKRNTENLRGVFESAIELFFGDNIHTTVDPISENPSLNKFWCEPVCFYYVQLMKNLFGGGKFSREMFLRFINEKSETADDLFAPAEEKQNEIAWINEINATEEIDVGLEG